MKRVTQILGLFLLVGFLGVMVKPTMTSAGDPTSGVQKQEQVNQLQNQSKLVTGQPAPQLTYSVERQNLIERMQRLNDKNLIGYVYLMSDTGQVIASYVTRGKVTSLESYLTGDQTLVDYSGNPCPYVRSDECYTLESPDYDGSYGKNPEGIFFFTDTGAMVEWAGRYVWTDQPLTIKTPVSLLREVK